MHITTLTFPQLRLRQRDGHKMRGYFANLFGKESDLWHNHSESGKAIYRYPRIQYKVINGHPMMVGIEEGATMLIERFLNIRAIEIDGLHFPLDQKNMKSEETLIGVRGGLYTYEFLAPWLALNQENFKIYLEENESARKAKLESILIRNIQGVLSAGGHFEKERMLAQVQVNPLAHPVLLKNRQFIGFKGTFVTNVQLPDYVGLGKSSSRGYGAIRKM